MTTAGSATAARAAVRAGGIRRRLVAVLTAVLCIWGLAAAPSASAHATVVTTDPADGTLLASAPARVTVTYNEAVSLQLGALRVFAPDGSQVEIGTADHLNGKPETATVPLKAGLKNGTYVVSWRVISADSHPVRGAWTFSIGTTSAANSGGAAAAPSGSRTVGVLFGVARWLAYLGFAGLAGGTLLLIAFAPKLAHDRRLRLLIGGGWFALLLGTVAALLLQGPYGGGFGIGRTTDADVLRATLNTKLGKALAWRLILLGAAGVLVSWTATRLAEASVRARQVAGGVGAALAVALAVTWSVADHSGTGSQVALALPADVLHLLAMATWVGGLAALAVSVLGPQTAALDADSRLKLVRRFSTTAFTAVCVLATTGIYQGWRQVRHWHALFGTDYGRMLIIKSSIFLTLLTLGYFARRILAADSPGPEAAATLGRRRVRPGARGTGGHGAARGVAAGVRSGAEIRTGNSDNALRHRRTERHRNRHGERHPRPGPRRPGPGADLTSWTRPANKNRSPKSTPHWHSRSNNSDPSR